MSHPSNYLSFFISQGSMVTIHYTAYLADGKVRLPGDPLPSKG